MKIKKTLFVIFFLTLATIFSVKNTYAKNYSLGIYPSIIRIRAIPPSEIAHNLRLSNFSDDPVVLKIKLIPFTGNDAGSGQVNYVLSKDYTLRNTNFLQNVKILENNNPISKIELAPKQVKNLILKIDIPKDNILTDYYFSIVFLTESNNTLDSTYSLIKEGIAANTLISVGSGDPKVIISHFNSPKLLSGGPVNFKIGIKNAGSHFVTAKGYILIKNMFGQTIGKVDINDVIILAESVRYHEATWNEKLLFGPYTATIYIDTGKGHILTKDVDFLVFPAKVVIILALILTFTITIIIRARNRLYK